MAGQDGGIVRYAKFNPIGILFYVFVAGSACLAVVGMSMAVSTHAPAWATLLFASLLAVSVPLGGVVSYVFFNPRRGAETFEHRS